MNTVMYAYVYVHIYALCQFKKISLEVQTFHTQFLYKKYDKCFIDKKQILCKTNTTVFSNDT